MFYVFNCSHVEYIVIYNYYILLLDWPFYHYVIPRALFKDSKLIRHFHGVGGQSAFKVLYLNPHLVCTYALRLWGLCSYIKRNIDSIKWHNQLSRVWWPLFKGKWFMAWGEYSALQTLFPKDFGQEQVLQNIRSGNGETDYEWLRLHIWPYLERWRNEKINTEPKVCLALGTGWTIQV